MDPKENSEAFPKRKEIKNTAAVDDMSPIDADAARRVSTVRPLTGFEKKIYDQINKYIQVYYEYVTYKQESLLMLLYLFPFPLIAATVPFLEQAVFNDNSYQLGFKVITMLVGLVALEAAKQINKRHAELNTVVKVVNGDATIRDICNVLKEKGHNKFLSIMAYTFCACLVAAELSLTDVPQYSDFGQGRAYESNLHDAATGNYTVDLFQASVGAQLGCYNCVGFKAREILYVPISDKLVAGGSLSPNSDVIMQSSQDIVSLDVSCFVITPTPRAFDSNLQVNVLGFNYGVQTAFMDFEISSFDSQRTLRARRCTLVSRDWYGIAKVRYKISESGNTARNTVEFIGPVSTDCTMIGDLCLDSPRHSDISVSLIKAAFPRSIFNIDRSYSQNFQMYPDPGRAISDADYADLIGNAVGMNFILGVSQFPATLINTALETDQVSVKLRMQAWITILTIISASICTLLAIILIVADVIRLGKTPDIMLRRLSQTLSAGKVNVEAISEYIFDITKDGPSENWDLTPVRFGEDRRTMLEPLGKLRFGGKKDIVKFKVGRVYY